MKKTVLTRLDATACDAHRTFSRSQRLFCLGMACAGSLILPPAASLQAGTFDRLDVAAVGDVAEDNGWLVDDIVGASPISLGNSIVLRDARSDSGYRLVASRYHVLSRAASWQDERTFRFELLASPFALSTGSAVPASRPGITGPVTSQIFPVTSASTDNARWVGNGGSDAWTDNGNWQGGNNPNATSTTITYYGDNVGRTYTDMSGYGSFFSTGSFYFDATSTQYNLGGTNTSSNSVRLFTSIENGPSYVAAGTAQPTQTFSATLALGGNVSFIARNGSLIIASANIYGDNHTLTLTGTAGKSITLSGSLANGNTANGLSLSIDTITATLSGSSSYSGATTLGTAATVNVNSATALGASAVNISGTGVVLNNTSGSAITLTNNNAVTITNSFAFGGSNSLSFGTGTASLNGDRVVTLNGNNSNTLAFGTLQNTANGGFTLTVNNAAGVTGETLVFNSGFNMQAATGTGAVTDILQGTGNIAINGPVTNGGTAANILNFAGTGTLTLGGVSTYTGATNITNTGTLSLTGTLGSGGGTAITANTTGGAFNESSAGVITGTSSLTVGGATATLAGTNTYTGTTALNGGTLNVNSAGALGSGNFNISGGILDNTSGAAITGQTNNPAITLTNTFAFGGSNSLNLGTGTLSNAGDRTINLNGNNTNTLTFALLQNSSTGGGFALNVNNAAGVSGETLVLGGFNLEAAAGTGGITDILKGSGNITVTGAIANGSATGNGLNYQGTGLLTLSGVSTYTGSTTFQSGTVNLTGTLGSGGGTSVTASGGTFNESAAGLLAGTSSFTTSGAAATLAGTNAYSGTTTVSSGTLNLTGSISGSNVNLTGGNFIESSSGAIAGSGTTLTDASVGTVTLGGANTYTGATTVGNGANVVTLNLTGSITGSNINVGGPGAGFTEATSGVIGGTGSTFTITSGAATLAGNNTYTGLTSNTGGALTLSGDNSSASGGVTLSAGTLNVNSGTALGTGTLTLAGGVLNNTSGAAVTDSKNNAVSITGSFAFGTAAGTTANSLNLGTGAVSSAISPTFTLNGAGALTFGGTLTNAATGAQTLTVTNGTGTVSTTALNFGGYALTGASDTAFQTDVINGNGTVNITGAVTDGTKPGSSLTYGGTGALTLSGASTHTGTTTVQSGSLSITGSTTGANLSVTGGSMSLSGSVNNGNVLVTGGTLTESTAGVIAGTGNTFTINGGTATLAGQNTYSGNTLANTSTLNIGADSTSVGGTLTSGPVGTGTLALNQETIAAVGGAHTIANPLAPNNDVAATIAGSQNLTFAGNLNLSTPGFSPHYTTFTVSNTGLTTFAGGINMNGQNLTFKGTGNVLINSAITGSAQYINSSDTGTLTLSGTNTYTGGTIGISAGTLLVNGSIASTGTVTIGNSTTATTGVTLGGNGSIAGNVVFQSTGSGTTILSPGPTVMTGSVGTLTTGALTLTSTTTSLFDVDGLSNFDKVVLSSGKTVTYAGTLTVDLGSYTPATGTTFQLFSVSGTNYSGAFTDDASVNFNQSGYTGTFTPSSGLLTITSGSGGAVPEPATWFGGLFALGTLGWFQRGSFRRRLWNGRRAA